MESLEDFSVRSSFFFWRRFQPPRAIDPLWYLVVFMLPDGFPLPHFVQNQCSRYLSGVPSQILPDGRVDELREAVNANSK